METKQKQEKPWFIASYEKIYRYKDIHFDELYVYNYYQQIVLDLYEFCLVNEFDLIGKFHRGFTISEIEELLYDMCMMDDDVTGNASGSYWFSQWYAEKALCHNFDLLLETLDDLGESKSLDLWLNYPEVLDVKIRCHLLRECIAEYVSEIISYYVED